MKIFKIHFESTVKNLDLFYAWLGFIIRVSIFLATLWVEIKPIKWNEYVEELKVMRNQASKVNNYVKLFPHINRLLKEKVKIQIEYMKLPRYSGKV